MSTKSPAAFLRTLDQQATPGPWRRCQAREGRCECCLIWSRPADAPVATTNVHNEEEGIPDTLDRKITDANAIVALRTLLPALADVVEAVGEFAHSTNVMAEAIPDGMDTEWEPTKELAKVYNAYYRLTAAVAELEGMK